MNTFYRIVLTVAMFSFYSTSWANPVPLPCEPNCTVDPCSPPLGPKPGCPGYPSPGPIGASVEKAQFVDPCQYECPKDGCPKCKKGDPIGAKAKADRNASDSSKSIEREKTTQPPIKQKAANSCDFCVCDRGTVKPSCTECCK